VVGIVGEDVGDERIGRDAAGEDGRRSRRLDDEAFARAAAIADDA
jgi:hypothetical protein